MWLRYVDKLSKDYRVILFDYPMQLKTNGELVTGLNEFFERLGICKPVLIGASDGGMIAQLYTRQYPDSVYGLVLISAGGMDKETLKSLKRKYFFAPIMLSVLKRSDYEKLKPRFIRVFAAHAKNESEEDRLYVKEMGGDDF